jgi:hypothetical protein
MLSQILSRLERAAVKDSDAYHWFTYTGVKFSLTSAKGRQLVLTKGSVFGVRKSSSGKEFRLIEQNKETIVYTISLEVAKKLAKACVPYANKKKPAAPPPAPVKRSKPAAPAKPTGKTWLTAAHRKIFDAECKSGGVYTMMAEIGQIPGVKLRTANEYWEWLKKQYAGTSIEVTRFVVLKQTKLSVTKLLKDAGTHWSSTEIEVPYHLKGIPVRIYAHVKPSQVDWQATMSNRVNYPGEQETTLRRGIMPTVTKVLDLRTNTELDLKS